MIIIEQMLSPSQSSIVLSVQKELLKNIPRRIDLVLAINAKLCVFRFQWDRSSLCSVVRKNVSVNLVLSLFNVFLLTVFNILFLQSQIIHQIKITYKIILYNIRYKTISGHDLWYFWLQNKSLPKANSLIYCDHSPREYD